MLAKLSYSIRKMLFFEALTCSYTLGILDPMLIFIDPFVKKKSIRMIFGCEKLFYQPNWEISSLVKRNNHLKGKKIHRKLCCDICFIF